MRTVTHAIWPAVAQAFRHAAAPLAWYYAVTLALPVANGAARSGTAFVEHAVVVLVLPVLIVLACAMLSIASVFGSKLFNDCSQASKSWAPCGAFDRSANPPSTRGGMYSIDD